MNSLDWLDDIQVDSSERIDERSLEYANNLLDTSGYDDNQKLQMQYEINDCLFNFELYDIIKKLKDAQPDRIGGGMNYNQTDIKTKLRDEDRY